MPLWGNNDATSNSCLFIGAYFNKAPNTANRDALFGNTSVNAFISGKTVGQFGVSTAEIANTGGESKKIAHPGWNLRTVGSGSITGIVITAGGTGYANSNLLRVTATNGVNASATLTTNATGGITTLTITNTGSGFVSVNPAVAVTNSTGGATGIGTGATFTATAGGRAGRVHYECLVAMGTITSDASDDTQLPE
jgi:hypothetical protein